MLNITTTTDTAGNIVFVAHTFTSDTATDQCVLDATYQESALTGLLVQRPGERTTIYKEDLDAKFAEHYAEFVARYA